MQSQNPVLDFAHKRQEKALEYQQAGRVVREGDHHIRYDANGRMVEKTRHQNGFSPQTTQYEWDETDRLIRVQLPHGEARPARTALRHYRCSGKCERAV